MMKSTQSMKLDHDLTAAELPSTMRRLPPLNMLRAFEATARHGSVTRAAAELSVTQSAVSHQIKALEDWIGTPLTQRDGRKVVLTAQGLDYFPSLSQALDIMSQATSRVEQKSRRNTLLVSVSATFAAQWLIPKLAQFCVDWPQLDVQLSTMGHPQAYDPAHYDISISCLTDVELAGSLQQTAWQGVQTGTFLTDALTPVCTTRLMHGNLPLDSPIDLQHHTLLHSRSRPLAWPDWLALAGVAHLRPANEITFDHIHLAVQAASQGVGLALGPPSLMAEMLDSQLLYLPFPQLQIDMKNYHWIRAPRTLGNHYAEAFCAWLHTASQPGPSAL
jgi:LysR family transcriptional regulator, glycine cleavage system transcriptional activator